MITAIGYNFGSPVVPAIGDVEEGVEYGDGGTELTGTFVVPIVTTVLDGIGYGEDGNEFVGVLEIEAPEPEVGDNILKEASNWLESERKTHMTEQVTYRRGAFSITLYATFGKTEYELDDFSGMTVGGSIIDFIITKLDIILDGEVAEPAYGDVIETVSQGNYEVMNMPGEGVSRDSDSFGKSIRIHTKQVF